MQRMDRLRRSLRESFRRKKDAPESSKPHQWQADEEAVRAGNCTFHVKYLGCIEVFESRGMQVCEEAMKVLRGSRRRPVKAALYVTGDGLRVVEDETKGLIVDQTIEKVSFCAPDRSHERGFSYICRDGTTRRWMCHGFLATKDSGERLSHAVGCAFAVCLERKQKREKECGVTMTYDSKTSAFTRSGSFRVTSMTDSLSSKSTSSTESAMNANNTTNANNTANSARQPAASTHAISRPHAPPKMLERQGSFRGFSQLSNHSPFKRQLSLRLNELPSNLQRTQNIFTTNQASLDLETNSIPLVSASPAPPPRTQRNRLHSLPSGSLAGGTIPEVSSSNTSSELNLGPPSKIENKDLVSELCQQVSHGLSLLAANHDESTKKTKGYNSANKFPTKFTNPWDEEVGSNKNVTLPIFNTTALATANSVIPTSSTLNSLSTSSTTKPVVDTWINNLTQSHEPKAPMQPKITPIKENVPVKTSSQISSILISKPPISSSGNRNIYETSSSATPASNTNNISTANQLSGVGSQNANNSKLNNSGSIASNNLVNNRPIHRGGPPRSQSLGADPFDADWATPHARNGQTPTNPFARQQTFQVSM